MFAALVADRDGSAPELTDVKRFHNDWEKQASIELRADPRRPSTSIRSTAGSKKASGSTCSTPSIWPGRPTPGPGGAA